MRKVLTALFFLSVSCVSSLVSANQWDIKRILVLHSYEPSYQWTADLQKGIDDALSQSRTQVKVSIEYLDTKRINDTTYYRSLANHLSIKYQNYDFDGVITTDDNAIKFLRTSGFIDNPNTPVVAVGVNDTHFTLEGIAEKGTIIYERDHIEKNIAFLVGLSPNLKNLYFVNDHGVTSELIRKEVVQTLTNYPSIELVEIRDKTLQQASEFLASISSSDAVLISHYNTEIAQGIYHSYNKIAHSISESSAAPVFALWQFMITADVLGGYVNHSESMGREAVVALDKYIDLDFKEDLEVESSSRVVFNYHAMNKFSISRNKLPSNTIIVNEPHSFIKNNYRLLLALLIVTVVLSAIILMQSVTLRQKKELTKKNKKILALQKRTLNVQKDMIHVLGEAIETRSGETGNHVKRVAKLSALLAKYQGLSHREVELLEIISPMHDVGKISIPETILDKPGKLTPSEWEVMKQHTTAGYHLLASSAGDITNLAAIIAYEHHERWDGKGYPEGKCGADIHLFARITAVADVFDALLSARCYKEPWPIDRVVTLFQRERGLQFDPDLTDILLHRLDEFVAIRDTYPDHN